MNDKKYIIKTNYYKLEKYYHIKQWTKTNQKKINTKVINKYDVCHIKCLLDIMNYLSTNQIVLLAGLNYNSLILSPCEIIIIKGKYINQKPDKQNNEIN